MKDSIITLHLGKWSSITNLTPQEVQQNFQPFQLCLSFEARGNEKSESDPISRHPTNGGRMPAF